MDDLTLWNTSYLQLAYRKEVASGGMPGRLRIDLEMADGGRVSLEEGGQPTPEDQASRWVLPLAGEGPDWIWSTVATARLHWGATVQGENQKRPALPIGQLKRITLALLDASPGAKLDIAYLRALRESGNGESAGASKLIGGRVTRLGTPVSGVNIELTDEAGIRSITTTDADGIYFFYGVPRQHLVSIVALDEGLRCTPRRGALMLVTRNDPEVDVDLDGCGRGSDQ
jgi:hypothetical protein